MLLMKQKLVDLLILLCFTVPAIMAGCSGGDSSDADMPVEIMLIKTNGKRHIVMIKASKEVIGESDTNFGQYLLLVRKNDTVFYSRLVDPWDVTNGSEKDLAISKSESPEHNWSVALERVVEGEETERVSNTIIFDPSNPNAAAVARPAMQPVGKEMVIDIGDEQLSVNGQVLSFPIDYERITDVFGMHSRPGQNRHESRNPTWENKAMFGRGQVGDVRSLGFQIRRSPFSIEFLPRSTVFAGKFTVNQKPFDTTLSEAESKKVNPQHSRISTVYNENGDLEFIEIKNSSN